VALGLGGVEDHDRSPAEGFSFCVFNVFFKIVGRRLHLKS
jgi:hypothetical protein